MRNHFVDWVREQLEKRSNSPRYIQLQQAIEAAIEKQLLKADEFLPPERRLAESLNISRVTVSKAMQLLEEKGVIVRQQGIGTQVAKLADASLNQAVGFTAQIIKEGGTVSNYWLSRNIIPAPADIAKKLSINTGEHIAELRRIRFANNTPVSLENTYIPQKYLPHPELLEGSLYAHWEEHNIHLTNVNHKIKAISCPAELAISLHVTENSPLLQIHQISFNNQNEIIEFSEILCRGDIYGLDFNSAQNIDINYNQKNNS
ncbi:GntR family transcriptional regulator [Xenorhabdus nematophila]|uniref:GntR-family transcriptional regulator n=1 Tax=Xenorhabdus nematophila (strain ATCC 19061 / DSM 3370 / CCUG 14189 / LMG 1036 / NCIMB 9965 / AN6) TaxID=406817 RepID=D3VG87_XENNA|nr:GntR family transcriptional regulator [Xenorhabdus nematophila]CEE94187.1 GntR-family transcriptional regulator [Xenorhabdus nematophila str. Anatoliense]CEF30976.1 GntR-family transcriptional regulator [Xenorhabdus nematophila str. Websteri]AYA41607.1 GntR family transcriptional regulator [Xenorhabdus nematophila]KHD28320.1 GntR family transcriptional regulator [Xenorhabdus nematophila]MBA0020346.1 GntR family transcriptional regulator [Xenorhabdus nematophila]